MGDLYLLALYRLSINEPAKWQRLTDNMRAGPEALRQCFEAESRTESGSPSLRLAEQDLRWLEQSDHHLVTLADDDYPARLRAIQKPPPILFGTGNRQCLARLDPAIAMVGSRKASGYGLAQARRIAADLAGSGMTIVSGLAFGIDAASHEGALEAKGLTIAVSGAGCDQVYPKRHWRLAERICDSGIILSEFPTSTSAYPGNFPRRNRIVTGLCSGTLVVEAATKSGSLISAKLAAAEGREVMALPGQVTNPQSRGCHQLIRDGATLIENAVDVLIEMGLSPEPRLDLASTMIQKHLTQEQQQVMAALAMGPQSIDELLRQHACPVEALTVTLVSLEVQGLISSHAGRYQIC